MALGNELMEGIYTGVQLGRQLQMAAAERRMQELQDVATLEHLTAVSRPIEGGTVEELAPAVSFTGASGRSIEGPGGAFRRKPEGSRTVKYRTAAGETIERELMTPEEQWQRQAAAAKAKRQAEAVEIPGLGVVDPRALPYYQNVERLRQEALESGLNRQQRATTAERTSLDRTLQEGRRQAGALTVARERAKATAAEGEKNRASRERIHATPGAGVQNRFEQNRIDKKITSLQSQHDKLNEQEQKIHVQAVEVGQSEGDPKAREAQVAALKKRAADLASQKAGKLAEIGKLRGETVQQSAQADPLGIR